MTSVAQAHAISPIQLDDEVAALLSRDGLTIADVDAPRVLLFGCRRPGSLEGLVGLEICGHAALLRSLAVAERMRGQGLGQALVAHAEMIAARHGVHVLYLLTTTAADFFARLGYVTTPRTSAPRAIAATSQFTGRCPASATFMAKSLRPSAEPEWRNLPA